MRCKLGLQRAHLGQHTGSLDLEARLLLVRRAGRPAGTCVPLDLGAAHVEASEVEQFLTCFHV